MYRVCLSVEDQLQHVQKCKVANIFYQKKMPVNLLFQPKILPLDFQIFTKIKKKRKHEAHTQLKTHIISTT